MDERAAPDESTVVDEARQRDRIAGAIREEIVRQYRDDDRRKCPAGSAFWEQHIQPMLLAEAALRALAEP
jgi:hypothetical protein